MQIERSDKRAAKTPDGNSLTSDPRPKVTADKESQPSKQFSGSDPTELPKEIATSEEQSRNAFRLTSGRHELGAKVI
jgi:hypothetical protein